MNTFMRRILPAALALAVAPAIAQQSAMLKLDQLLGTWNMSYDMGQGTQSGTITISRADDGSPKIVMDTTGGGRSEATDIKIEGDSIMYSRNVSAQGQSLGVNYSAKLIGGNLEGTFEVDLGGIAGAAGAGLGGPTAWRATKAE